MSDNLGTDLEQNRDRSQALETPARLETDCNPEKPYRHRIKEIPVFGNSRGHLRDNRMMVGERSGVIPRSNRLRIQ